MVMVNKDLSICIDCVKWNVCSLVVALERMEPNIPEIECSIRVEECVEHHPEDK